MGGNEYRFAWDSTLVRDGIYRISAQAVDAVGNIGEASEVLVEVVTQAPAPEPEAPVEPPVPDDPIQDTIIDDSNDDNVISDRQSRRELRRQIRAERRRARRAAASSSARKPADVQSLNNLGRWYR